MMMMVIELTVDGGRNDDDGGYDKTHESWSRGRTATPEMGNS